jgi:hypothetical protein
MHERPDSQRRTYLLIYVFYSSRRDIHDWVVSRVCCQTKVIVHQLPWYHTDCLEITKYPRKNCNYSLPQHKSKMKNYWPSTRQV